ncbi:hypothetical protein A9Q94_20230 [Rhodobacterales bacterium 56_14_T64]|nr:hypothetical protein A9Q94_20230 [Rhodobacterales bacterium 56_14_T64]
MDLKDCIPKDKFDLAAIDRAVEAGFPQINPILPDLLEWIKDGNWPVALPTASLLSGAGPEIIPFVKSILNADDGMWKYWTIGLVVRPALTKKRMAVQADLGRLTLNPSQDDLNCDVVEQAKAVLLGLKRAF